MDFARLFRLRRFMVLALLVSGLASIGSSIQAQIIRYVATTGTTTNPASATSWATSTTDLQGAINASQSGDQVWVAVGVYKPTTYTGPESQTVSFSMKNSVAIYGGFVGTEKNLSQRPTIVPNNGQPSSSTLSGEIGDPSSRTDNSHNLIYNNNNQLNNTAVLDGFVLTDSYSDPITNVNIGGAIHNVNSSPMIINCSFFNNQGLLGGGLNLYLNFYTFLNYSEHFYRILPVLFRFNNKKIRQYLDY